VGVKLMLNTCGTDSTVFPEKKIILSKENRTPQIENAFLSTCFFWKKYIWKFKRSFIP
jgi:hypothetical protein